MQEPVQTPQMVVPGLGATTPEVSAPEIEEKERALARLVAGRFQKGLSIRRAHEGQWFVNGAFFKGYQYVEWSGRDHRLQVPPSPPHRVRLTINRIQPKVRARVAKFLKNRPIPMVIPATTEIEDRLDARATTKFLDYIWRKLDLERKYSSAVRWASITNHGYWWFHWDPKALGKIQDSATKKAVLAEVGEIEVEIGTAFELVVADPTLEAIGLQPWIIRAKRRSLGYIKSRYPEKAPFVKGETEGGDVDAGTTGERYAKQLGNLAPTSQGGSHFLTSGADTTGGDEAGERYCLVKELYERPCAEYPKGRYVVATEDVVLRQADALPFFADFKQNPYPVVDFPDFPQVGQYWGTTVIEQLIQPQREYNLIRSKLAEHLRVTVHPKLITFKQHNIAPGVWTNEAGEVVVAGWQPGLPLPQPYHPPPISRDAWQSFELLKGEIEDITQIFPESEGKAAGATSGFQTNLLQEATDMVHGPDIRAHELCIEEAAYKLRRLAKLFYTPARLITIAGNDLTPESFEFHRDDIDESADVVVQAGSALPTLKAAKVQAIMEMWTAGLLGEQNDPQSRAKALQMMEMGTTEDLYDSTRRNEEQARQENAAFLQGGQVAEPEFFENHDVHFRVHSDELTSARSHQMPQETRMAHIRHLLLHIGFVNPAAALTYAQQYGLMDLVQKFQPQVVATPPPAPAAPGGEAAAPGAAPASPQAPPM
jgi:hypothetical protein